MSLNNFNPNKIVYIYKSVPSEDAKNKLNNNKGINTDSSKLTSLDDISISNNINSSRPGSTVGSGRDNYTPITGPFDGGFILESDSGLNMSFSYTNNYDELSSKLLDKGGGSGGTKIIQAVKGVSEMLSGGKYILQNTNVKTWKGTSPIGLPDSIKLRFYYGMKGTYNCQSEVWDPIISLVKEFAPNAKRGDGTSGNFIYHGVPTMGQAMMAVLDNLFSEAEQPSEEPTSEPENNPSSKTDKSKKSEESGGTGLLNKNDAIGSVNKAISSIYGVVDEQLQAIKDASTLYKIELGGISFTDLYIGSVRWSFDFGQVDTNGYPYKGTVELGGIESSKYTTQSYIESIFSGTPTATLS